MEELKAAVSLLESSKEGALATLENTQHPFVSAVGFLYERVEGLGTFYLLLSDLARHTRNLSRDPKVSLLVVEKNEAAPIHERKRMTVQGRVKRVEDKERFQELSCRYLKIFPRSEMFFALPDFRFYEFQPEEIHWIGGFGKAAIFR